MSRAATILAGLLMTAPALADPFSAVLKEAGVQHGVAVHLGCEDPTHLTALARERIRQVHGLLTDKELVAAARRLIQKENLGERVAVVWQGSLARLPYADNLINLVVVENAPKLLSQGLEVREVFRVLVPRGVVCFHGAVDRAGLSSAGFTQVRSVNGWTYGSKPLPREMDDWPQMNHDVTGNRVSNDRLVGPPTSLRWIHGPSWPTAAGVDSVPDAVVSANGRIFYNGVAESTTGKSAIVARDAYNGTLLWERTPAAKGHPASFLAHGDRHYCCLEGSLVALSAATGETVFKYDINPASVLYHEGLLIAAGRGLTCLDAVSGAVKWQFGVPVAPSRLSRGGQHFANIVIGDGKVFYLNTQDDARRKAAAVPYILGCVDIKSGSSVWRKEIKPEEVGWNLLLCAFHDGALILGEGYSIVKQESRAVHGFSAKDGTALWRHEFEKPSHGGSRADGFFVDGLYWIQVLDSALAERLQWRTHATGWRALDPTTGKVVKTFDYPRGRAILHRCYMDRATTRFFLTGTGDFVEPGKQEHTPVCFLRSTCQQGMLPANGLVYAYPHGCQCASFLRGFMALAAEAPGKAGRRPTPPDLLLEKGPAFGSAPGDPRPSAEDWPCYRHDDTRGLTASTVVSPRLTPAWQVQLGAGLTAPVAAEGLVFVARSGAHELIALNAENGREAWRFLADGPIDTPPTIYKGLALFGCRDGSVYALRARDGVPAWRLRMQPEPHLITVDGRLESLHAIHGSITIRNDVACFAAGRHSCLDGGVSIHGVKPATGEILWRRILHTPDREGYLADVLVGHGEKLYMGLLGLDPSSGKVMEPAGSYDPGRFGHLVAGRGSEPILERAWCARSLRQKGPVTGYVLAFDEKSTYGLTLNKHYHGKSAYTYMPGLDFPPEGVKLFRAEDASDRGWSITLPCFANSLLRSGDSLFVGGTADSPDSRGGVLRAYATGDGSPLGQWSVDSVPVNDGLAAARGCLYVATRNGRLYCFRRNERDER